MPDMWDRPPPGEGCASEITGFLICLAVVIVAGFAIYALVDWVASW